MAAGYHPALMERAYAIVLAIGLLGGAFVGLVLVVLQVLALRGIQLLPPTVHRWAGAGMTGLIVGLTALLMWGNLLFALGIAAFLAWIGRWYAREGRLRELGLLLVVGGAAWVLVLGWTMVVARFDPTIGGPDMRLPAAAGGLVVAAAGLWLMLAAPRPAGGSDRLHGHRLRAVARAFERAQSIGPVAAGPALGLVAALLASTAVDLLLHETLGMPLRPILAIGVFVAVGSAVWIGAMPPRVVRASEALGWLVAREQERWSRAVGRRLPFSPRNVPRLLEQLPPSDLLRPLRVELLAVANRMGEARGELEQLPETAPDRRFERAALAEYIALLEGRPDQRAPMREALAEIEAAEPRLEAVVSLAVSDARRAAVNGGDAIGPLADVRAELGELATRRQFGYRRGVLLVVAAMGIVAAIAVVVTSALVR
jgi:hypothetical protein